MVRAIGVPLRRGALLLLVVVALVGGAPVPGDAATTDDDWTVEAVPGSDLRFSFPGTWQVASSEQLARLRAAMPTEGTGIDMLLAVIDPAGANDNISVNRYSGTDAAEWWTNFAEFRSTMELSADQSDGKVVAMGKRRVGGRPLYWSIERDPDPIVGVPMLFTEIELREAKDVVLTFSVTISTQSPHPLATTRRVIAGITSG
ncbi:MAG: hypothetical protein U0W40_01910 [Acidimicrobiia bacterium]